ncbi:MAG: hypothetical protein IPJ65_22060 [Archangiaceae bacterium]|nr:hypothetical protein [Archangiaceae bacterium]
MSAAWLAVLLCAAPTSLAGLGPLRAGAPAARVTPSGSEAAPPGKSCTFEKLTFAAPVRLAWSAHCFGATPWGFGLGGDTAVVPTSQRWLAFDAKRAAEFDGYGAPPGWVPKDANENARPRPGAPPSFRVLGTDERDGSVLGHSYERGYLRWRPGTSGDPLFGPRLPPETNTPRAALVPDADRSVKAPWLVYAPDPWRNGEVRVRDPSGAEETLLHLPPRAEGGTYRVEELQALRVGAEQRPLVTALVDRAHLLFVPLAGGGYSVRALQPAPYLPPSGPPGSPPCTEAESEWSTEEHFAPRLFEHHGRAYLAYVSEDTYARLRSTIVPVERETPQRDALTCANVVDARASERSLVIAEVLPSGEVAERQRIAVRQLGYGSTLALELRGDRLDVLTGSMSFVNWLVLELGSR